MLKAAVPESIVPALVMMLVLCHGLSANLEARDLQEPVLDGIGYEVAGDRTASVNTELLQPQEETLLPTRVRVRRTSGAPVVVTVPQPQTAVDSSLAGQIRRLPFTYEVFTDRGEAAETDLVVHPDKPLRYDEDREHYRGSLYLGLRDTGTPSASRRLSTPVPLLLTSEAVEIQPDQPIIDHTNFPLAHITVSTPIATDSVAVKIVPEYDMDGELVWLVVEPHLRVDNPPVRMPGLGVGSRAFTIRIAGVSKPGPVTLIVEASRGYVDPGRASVGEDGSVTVRLRSQGIGNEMLTASAPGMTIQPIDLPVSYTWPIWFTVAAVLGGLAGAFLIRRWTDEAKSGLILEGVVYGLVGAIAYAALDVNLLRIPIPQPFAEATVFGFSALLILVRHVPNLVPIGLKKR